MGSANTIHSYDDARRLARRRLPWMVFDYIDGAAGNGVAEMRNLAALRDITLQPRVLRNVAERDLSVTVFEQTGTVPFGISPMGMCNLSGPGADVAFAQMAAKHRVPVGVSTVASTSLENMIEHADGHAWFQLYFSGDGSGTSKLVERAKAAGYTTLIMTLDVPEVGRRPRELRRGFKMPFKIGPKQFVDFALHPQWSISSLLAGAPTLANFEEPGFTFDRTESRAAADWEFLKRLRDQWSGKIVAKGVTDVEDAVRLTQEGIDAIQVSTHGGRQLDCAPAPIHALKRIRDAVGPAYPLFYDTGLRSGEDVVKAYHMGASFVFFGRAMQFAYAAGGKDGLLQFWDLIAEETSLTLAQIGQTTLAGVGKINE
ncbi:MAG: alpha-hydroxy acid oxidase [Roseobacter sp.]